MVREYRLETVFPACTPQEFFDAIYADEVSMKIYLKLNTVPGGFTVSEWKDNRRHIEFTKELKLPAALSAMAGTDVLPVKDVQTLERLENGDFTVSSCPVLQMSIGNKFKGKTAITVRSHEAGSLVEVLITCEALGPWGMINVIESYMEEEAKLGVESFLTFCETRIADIQSESNPSIGSSSDEQFYDVRYESLSQVSSSASENHGDPGMLTTESIIALRLKKLEEDACISSEGIDKILKKMEAMEQGFKMNQKTTYWTIVSLSALSVALTASLIYMKHHQN